MTRRTFDEVKQIYRIEDIAERLGIDVVHHSSEYLKCKCPFHDDQSPSFVINKKSQIAGCKIPGCHPWGDIFSLVMHYMGVTHLQAKDWIEGTSYAPKREITKKVVYSQRSLMPELRNSLQHQHFAIAEWGRRGLSEEVVRQFQVGAIPNYRAKFPYVLQSGEKVNKLSALRYSIPWVWNKKIWGIKLRLDVPEARRQTTIDFNTTLKIKTDIASKYNIPIDAVPESVLINALFGDRYLSVGGSRFVNRIYNSRVLVDVRGGQLEYPKRRVAMWSEGEINAQTAQGCLNIPAIAGKSRYMAQALKNVDVLIIVQDNDKVKTSPDGEQWIPGEEYANDTLVSSERTLGETAFILTPPSPYNDLNDMQQAGVLKEWMWEQTKNLPHSEYMRKAMQ